MESSKLIVSYKDTTFECYPPLNYDDLIQACKSQFNLLNEDMQNFTLVYKDDDDDKVLVSSQYDYDQAISFLKSSKNNHQLQFTLDYKINQSIVLPISQLNQDQMRSGVIFDKQFGDNEESYSKPQTETEIEEQKKLKEELIKQTELHLKQMQEFEEDKKKFEAERSRVLLEEQKIKIEKANMSNIKVLFTIFKQIRKIVFNQFIAIVKQLPLDPNKFMTEEQLEQKRKERRKKVMELIRQKAQDKSIQDSKKEYEQIYASQIQTVNENYRRELEAKMQDLLTKEITAIKEGLLSKSLAIQQEVMKNYITEVSQIDSHSINQKPSELSQFNLQNQLNQSNGNKVIHEVDCDSCNEYPIMNIRYKCSICKIYNLCEKCEELNSQTKMHNHLFFRMREPSRINERKYAFQIIKNNTIFFNRLQSKATQYHHQIEIKNTGILQWNSALLQCSKTDSTILCFDCNLMFLMPNSQQIVNIVMLTPLEIPEGDYSCVINVWVGGKMIKEVITINLSVLGNNFLQKVNAFRQQFNLDINQYSNEVITNALTKCMMNYEMAFESLFV